MQTSTMCYRCDKPAIDRCQSPDQACPHTFCSSHGNLLCQDCQDRPPDDDAGEREYARERFFRTDSALWRLIHLRPRQG